MELAQARKARIVPRTGGRALADALVAQGIDHVFAVPGESYLDVLDGLYEVRQKLKLVTCRFEAGAVHMAEAYGKLNGRPAAAIVTRGPGACHGAIGVHVAMQDSTPMLLFVGQIPLEDTGRDAFQEVDYRRMFSPLAKWVTQIDQAKRIPEVVAHAVDVAVIGPARPGGDRAVGGDAEGHDRGPGSAARRGVAAASRSGRDGAAARDAGAARSKPLAVLGGSCWTEEGRAAHPRLPRSATTSRSPSASAARRCTTARSTISPATSASAPIPACVGKAKEADLILAIGSRLGDAVTQGYTLLDMAGSVPIIQVHPDGSEIGRVFRPALGIVSDLNAFAHAVAALEPVQPNWADWTEELRSLREAQRAVPNYEARSTSARRCASWRRCWIPMRSSPPMPATSPAGQRASSTSATASATSVRPTARWATACRRRSAPRSPSPTAWWSSLVGDGGFLMTGQEIATAFHHGVAPIVLVFNNQMYGTIRMHQERAYPGRVSGTALTNPDFAKFIEAFGGHGEVVSDTAEFAPAFRRAVDSGRPAVIELRMNPNRSPRVPRSPTCAPARWRSRRRSRSGRAAPKHPKPARGAQGGKKRGG